MLKNIKEFLTDKSGLTSFETAVMAAVVIGAIVVTWNTFLKDPFYDTQERIGDWMQDGQDASN